MEAIVARIFLTELAKYATSFANRRWLYVPYDQLNDTIGPLGYTGPEDVGIVLCESLWKGQRRPYHKQKLALILANQRHFALEQARRGVAVKYLMGTECYRTQLEKVTNELGSLEAMEPAERELRHNLAPLVEAGRLTYHRHEGWLTTTEDFETAMRGKKQWRMDGFYRHVRIQYGYLLEANGKPVGGKWSHDDDNRHPWPGAPTAPTPPRFDVDPITREVCTFVEQTFPDNPGTLSPESLPATLEDSSDSMGLGKA